MLGIFSNIFTINSDGTPTRDGFMRVLETWEANFAFDTYFMIKFDIPSLVTDQSLKDHGEMIQGVNFAKKRLQSDAYTRTVGCVFCTGITMPQDSVRANYHPSVGNRGFIGSPYIQSRDTYMPLSTEIYESNLSYSDFILKPWTILASHRGLAAPRNPSKKITTNMVITELAKGGLSRGLFGASGGLIPRKVTTIFDCCPVRVMGRRIAQSSSTDVSRSSVEWIYSRYKHELPQAAKAAAGKGGSGEGSGFGVLGRLLGI